MTVGNVFIVAEKHAKDPSIKAPHQMEWWLNHARTIEGYSPAEEARIRKLSAKYDNRRKWDALTKACEFAQNEENLPSDLVKPKVEHYLLLAEEIAKKPIYQSAIDCIWKKYEKNNASNSQILKNQEEQIQDIRRTIPMEQTNQPDQLEPIFARDLKVKLHGPGPSDVPNTVLQALRMPTIGHLDPAFISIMDETKDMLRQIYQTNNLMTFPVSGTGSAGMQTLCANILEKSEYAFVVENGVFGRRITDCLNRLGVHTKPIKLDWGETLTPKRLEDEMYSWNANAVFLVHADTSAGCLQNDMGELSDIIHSKGALFIADMVTSLGGCNVTLDDWGVDAAFSGSQKCLSCPPGLAPISLNETAMQKVRKRKTKVPSWYLDITGIEKYWNEGNTRTYHHTAPINMIYALHEGLRLCLEEGLENRVKRHKDNSDKLTKGLEALGFKYHIENKDERTPMLHLVYLPGEDTDEGKLRSELKQKHNIEVAGGLGDLAGKAWRIGIMGGSCTDHKVDHLLLKIGEVLYENKLTDCAQKGFYAGRDLL